jgi:hypothetical protein
MTTAIKKQLELDAVFFIMVGIAVGSFFVLHTKTNKPIYNPITIPQQQTSPTATPTVVFTPTTSSASQISSDGNKKVTVNATENEDGTKTYAVSTDDAGTAFFSKPLNVGETISIPFNAWSPDNRYFFIKENLTDGAHILVFRETGEPFANGESYLDLTDIYNNRVTGNTFGEATGWAAENLIIINTTRDKNQGPSYWFEVPSKAVIQLGTKF